jgi:hypothetical protein
LAGEVSVRIGDEVVTFALEIPDAAVELDRMVPLFQSHQRDRVARRGE